MRTYLMGKSLENSYMSFLHVVFDKGIMLFFMAIHIAFSLILKVFLKYLYWNCLFQLQVLK